jgi:endoglucanase
MKKHVLLLVIWFALFARGSAQSVAQTRCNNLGKGVNLSNWLEGYWETNWPDSADYSKQFFWDMKAAGLSSFRMPVCFALVTDTLPPYYVDTTNRVFGIIDSIISWTTQLNMNVIIDNQHLWNIYDSTWRGQLPRLAHLWAVLAQRYNYLDPNRYIFEILNEPNGISNDTLPLLYNPVIDTIRQYAPYHTIVAAPTDWSNGFGYYSYHALPDTNLIYTFHSYDPYNFTSQGLSFVEPQLPTGLVYPGSGYDELLPLNWDYAIQFKDTSNLPLFLGEFGVGDSADAQSRCNWFDTIGARIEANHLSAFYWDVVGDFKVYHSGTVAPDSIIPCFAGALHWYGDSISAVQNVSARLPVRIFPNPANNYFICEAGNNQPVTVQVFDNTGRMVLQSNFINQTTINTGAWATGMYIVKVVGTGGVSVDKVVVE